MNSKILIEPALFCFDNKGAFVLKRGDFVQAKGTVSIQGSPHNNDFIMDKTYLIAGFVRNEIVIVDEHLNTRCFKEDCFDCYFKAIRRK